MVAALTGTPYGGLPNVDIHVSQDHMEAMSPWAHGSMGSGLCWTCQQCSVLQTPQLLDTLKLLPQDHGFFLNYDQNRN